MFHQNFIPWKSKSPVTFWITGVLCDCSQKKDIAFRRCLLSRVPGRTRTVDIQNHKQLHGFSAILFVHRCFRGLRKPCLRLFCGYLYFELKFAKSFPFLILHFLTAICNQILLDLIAFFKAFFESFFKLSFAALFQFQQ